MASIRFGMALAFGPALALVMAAAAGPAWAAAPIPMELNKLEPIAGAPAGCRAYLVAQNPDADPFEQLRLDLVLFGTDGVIERRIALDVAPLGAGKTTVRLFDLQGLPCSGIARILVNDVLACRGGKPAADLDRDGCLDRLAVTTRTAVPFVK